MLREKAPDSATTVRAVEVGGYFNTINGRADRWWFGTVLSEERARVAPFQEPRFHRTLSTWINPVAKAGFVVERLEELCAGEATAAAVSAIADTRMSPLFPNVRGRKPPLSELQRRSCL